MLEQVKEDHHRGPFFCTSVDGRIEEETPAGFVLFVSSRVAKIEDRIAKHRGGCTTCLNDDMVGPATIRRRLERHLLRGNEGLRLQDIGGQTVSGERDGANERGKSMPL